MKRNGNLRALIIVVLIIIAAVLLVRHFHIKRFCVIEPGVLYTSGQPRGMDYTRLLYKYHIATIVNVRSPSEHRERNWYNEEITWVKNNGVRYEELPIEKTNYYPDSKTQKLFLSLMAEKTNLPVLVHGSSGRRRPSMLAAVWLAKEKKLTPEQIINTVEKIKKRPVTNAEKKFIKSLYN